MIGTLIFEYTSHTMRTAIGRIAGPLNPPDTMAIREVRLSISTLIPLTVLIKASASVPARRQPALSRYIGHVSDNLVIRAFLVAETHQPHYLTCSWTRPALSITAGGDFMLTFGQDIFISSAETSRIFSKRLARATNSSDLFGAILTTIELCTRTTAAVFGDETVHAGILQSY
jgi:hypothetical protein